MPTRMRMRNACGAARAVKLLTVLCPRPPVSINRAPRKLMSQAIPALLRSTARCQVGLINYGRRPGTMAFGLVTETLNLCIGIIGEQYKNNGIKPRELRNRIMG